MIVILIYAALSIGLLIILFIAACIYLALRYSGDDENEYEQHERWP